MAIGTIGKLPLQVPENGSAEFVTDLIQQMKSMILHLIGRCIEESLETQVERKLGRKRFVRRRRAKRKETGIYCSKCRSHQRQDFTAMGITSASRLFSGVASTCRHRKPSVVVVGTCV